jgi:large subunit ribosomal protein L4
LSLSTTTKTATAKLAMKNSLFLNKNYYHSQTCSKNQQQQSRQQNMPTLEELDTLLPPNLSFDLRSSFAPQQSSLASLAQDYDDDDIAVSDKTDGDADDYKSKDKQQEILNQELERRGDIDDEYDDDDDDYDDDEITDGFVSKTSYYNFLRQQKEQLVRPVVSLPERLNVPILDGPKGPALVEEESDGEKDSSTAEVGSIWLDGTVFGTDDIRTDLIKQNVDYIRAKIRGRRNAKTKTISERSGSGRKVRPQKGQGKARAGHSRPPHWRGGCKAHGPKNTVDYGNRKLNKKMKRTAIRSMLSQKLKEGNLIVVNHLFLESHKTGPWAKILNTRYGVGKSIKMKKHKRKTASLYPNLHVGTYYDRYSNNDSDDDAKQGFMAVPSEGIETTTTALIVDHYLDPENGNENNDNTRESGSAADNHASYRGVPVNLWVATNNVPRVNVINPGFLNVYEILKKEKLIITLSALEEIERKWKE